MTPEDKIADELRLELEARIATWKHERAKLQQAQARIAELDQLIAFAEAERPQFKVTPRPRPATAQQAREDKQ